MKTLQTFIVDQRSSIKTDNFTFHNALYMPVNVTVDAFDSVVERQALKIIELEDEVARLAKFEPHED